MRVKSRSKSFKSQLTKMKSPNTIQSSQIIASSFDDILTEILLKIPIKPLIRSKLVTKHWLSLITSHHFSVRRNPTPNPAQGFFLSIKTHHIYRYVYVSLYPNKPHSFVPSINSGFVHVPLTSVILHSCNGLLLRCSSNKSSDIDVVLSKSDCSMHVYNPTTNLSAELPGLPGLNKSRARKSATLVFDPVKSPYYKVVLGVVLDNLEIGESETCEIRVYSSETREWSYGGEIGKEMKSRVDDITGSGVYWNGSVHWLNSYFSTKNPRNWLRFHVDTREIREMPCPPVVGENSYARNVYFGESCDHLHFVECVLPRFNVYEMKRDYSEWFVKYKVDLSLFKEYLESIDIYNRPNLDSICVLSLIREGNGEEPKIILRVLHKAIKFNLVDGAWEKLCDFGNDRNCHETGFDEHGLDYIQSLCSV